jgi:hypothetical protein
MGHRISRFLGFPIRLEVLLAAIRRLTVPKCSAVTVLGIDAQGTALRHLVRRYGQWPPH